MCVGFISPQDKVSVEPKSNFTDNIISYFLYNKKILTIFFCYIQATVLHILNCETCCKFKKSIPKLIKNKLDHLTDLNWQQTSK